ncbi:MAG: flagellar biosynthesis protein FlhB [bacterium]|nr:flagellar biosynthesis protein FlhB [bacterium]
MGEDSGDKTEEPTPHKLREARNKGQIAKSKEFTSAILLLASFYTLKGFAMTMWGKMSGLSVSVFSVLGEPFSGALAGFFMREGLKVTFSVLMPLFLVIMILAIILEALQTNFLISAEPLAPKLDNINPISGFKKFFSLKQYVELIKSLIKMSIVIALLYFIIRDEYFIITQSQVRNIWLIMGKVGAIVMKVVTQIGVAYFFIALLDFVYQRYEFIKSMRMTKKEIKEEYKRLEGDPTVKQRQREAQRNMAQGRQMGAVPGADVVVTNPVHVAVALKYDQNENRAPIVLAKGRRLVAHEIKRIAEEHFIPIMENPPLARAIFKESEVGDEIPVEYYKIVAEILAFVFNLKKNRKR